MGLCDAFCGIFLIKLPPDYPCKPYDRDHQWADFVMAWLA